MADDKNPRAAAWIEQLTPITFDDLVRMASRIEFPVGLESRDAAEADNCGRCWACMDAADITPMGYVLCPECGNKRCPHAADHTLECGQSNESGQLGATRYPKLLDSGSTP